MRKIINRRVYDTEKSRFVCMRRFPDKCEQIFAKSNGEFFKHVSTPSNDNNDEIVPITKEEKEQWFDEYFHRNH